MVSQEYSSGVTAVSKKFTFEFSKDSLSLDLPKEGKVLDGGWMVVPMHPPKVCALRLWP